MRALETGAETLNGYPLLSVPEQEIRELITEFGKPVSLRHGTPRASALVERALKVGVHEIEGGPLSYTLPYSRNVELVEAIKDWSKVEEMCHKSSTGRNEKVIRETFGVLTACLVHPIQSVLTGLLESGFVALHGESRPMASFGSTGCAYQDLASIEAYRELLPWWLAQWNLGEREPLVSMHHWMGPFPQEDEKAMELIIQGTLIAMAGKAQKVVVKTLREAHGVPTPKENADAVKYVSQLLKSEKKIRVHQEILIEEKTFLMNEVKDQLITLRKTYSNYLELIEKSVAFGFIDPPFAPHVSVKHNLRALRANDGSIRVSSDFSGNVSSNFIKRETSFLGSINRWSEQSADQIAMQIYWPGCYELDK
jgi:methylaspartate mutase epsilon subunit